MGEQEKGQTKKGVGKNNSPCLERWLFLIAR